MYIRLPPTNINILHVFSLGWGLSLKKCCTCIKTNLLLIRKLTNLILEQTILTYRKSHTHIHKILNSATQKQLCTMLWNIVQILFVQICLFSYIQAYFYSLKFQYMHTTYLDHLSLSPAIPRIPHHISLTTSCISFLRSIYLFCESNSSAHMYIVWGQLWGHWELTSSHILNF